VKRRMIEKVLLLSQCCTVLYRTALHSVALYYTVPYRTVLHCTVLHYTVLHYTLLHYTLLYCTAVRTVDGLYDLQSYVIIPRKPSGPSKTRQDKTGQSRAGQGMIRQHRAGQVRTRCDEMSVVDMRQNSRDEMKCNEGR
jgi:hypothetical protein